MLPGSLPQTCRASCRPTRWALALLAVCVLPLLAMSLGVSFDAHGYAALNAESLEAVDAATLNDSDWNEFIHASAHGSYAHTILEWTALCAAIFAAILAFCLYSMVRDPSLPVIGIAMLCAGLMDGFHTLAADRLVDAAAPNTQLVPFTWALCRMFNASILLIGVGLFAFGRQHLFRVHRYLIPVAGTFFLVAAFATMHLCTTSAALPRTMFEDAVVKRPYDIYSLVQFAFCALVIFPRYLERNRSLFAWSLVLSMIPHVATQLYMAFGSSQLHDSCFNIGHALKVVGYAVPAIGLLFTYQQAFADLQSAQVRLAGSDLVEKISARATLDSAEAQSETDILASCVRGVSELTNWPIGRVCFVHTTEDGEQLQTSPLWQAPSNIEACLQEPLSASVPIHDAEEIVKAVWSQQTAVWTSCSSEESRIPSLDSEFPASVRSAFAFPVIVDSQLIAVLQFATEQTVPLNEKLHSTIRKLISAIERIIGRRREQEALRVSEQRFHLAVAGSNDGIWDWDIRTGKTWYSPRFRELLNCDDAEAEGLMQHWKARLHADDREHATVALQAHLKGHLPFDVEHRLRCNSGEYRWFRSRGQAVWNEYCQPTRMAGSLTDITAQKQAEHEIRMAQQALFASEQHLRAMIDATPECVKLVDRKGRLLEINAVGLLLTEFDRAEEVVGKCVYDIIAPQDRARFIAFNERICGGQRGVLEFRIIGARGSHRQMETSAVPLTLQDGTCVHLGITREITEQKRRNAALQKAKEAAESASRAKSEFLANMSHEIRTPMNGILGMTELALGTSLDAEQSEYLETVRDSGESLLATINDVLDFSKVEAGMLQLESAAFNLHRSVAITMKPLQMRAAQKQLDCQWTVADSVPEMVLGDGHRLQQILTNLVGNAIKFTATGSVRLFIDCEQNGPNWNRLQVKVTDTGVGIPEDKQKSIFDAFSQADYSTTRNFGGTGLGLAITTQLVELMGGTVTVESTPGQGTTFAFTANFGVCQSSPTSTEGVEHADATACRPLLVLLAEDNRVNQRFAQRLLEKQGHRVLIADDGRKAIELTKTRQPDVVLMDIQMPELDGYQATHEIRRLEMEGQRWTPIVAMTAHAMKGDRERCLAHGMDDYVTKPVRKAELFRALNKVTADAFQQTAGDPAQSKSATHDAGNDSSDNSVDSTIAAALTEEAEQISL